jgi:hypothetical protein
MKLNTFKTKNFSQNEGDNTNNETKKIPKDKINLRKTKKTTKDKRKENKLITRL